MSRCAVLGPGGVGGLLAVLLTDAGHEVVVVARTSSVETLRESGFHLSSPAAMPALATSTSSGESRPRTTRTPSRR